ncbi:hypothetical protein T492DRAFT_1058500 [Pavlovales sp. CCMP2436]|nr:hypothetical protein T492DRAFT_1058500 [Pavlovales sp. CCMP2436]
MSSSPGRWCLALGLAALALPGAATTASASAARHISRIQARAREVHAKEFADGVVAFGGDDTDALPLGRAGLWTDDDQFVVRSVGVGHAGPDEAAFGGRGHLLFATAEPVFAEAECEALIAEARAAIAAGRAADEAAAAERAAGGAGPADELANSAGGKPTTNSALGEARVSSLPMGRAWLRKESRDKLYPLLEARFGIPAEQLTLNDALIIGYIGPSRSQPVHRDASLLSLNVALSPRGAYEGGGGTYFPSIEGGGGSEPLFLEQGHLLCHASGVQHAGNGLARGERWILVLFVLAEQEPQLARRCHVAGGEARAGGDLVEAAAAFEAGLAAAPHDHQLHMSLGSVHFANGERAEARACLARAQAAYTPCVEAAVALGQQLIEANRPRAALRRFDAALASVGMRDRPAPGGSGGVAAAARPLQVRHFHPPFLFLFFRLLLSCSCAYEGMYVTPITHVPVGWGCYRPLPGMRAWRRLAAQSSAPSAKRCSPLREATAPRVGPRAAAAVVAACTSGGRGCPRLSRGRARRSRRRRALRSSGGSWRARRSCCARCQRRSRTVKFKSVV